MDRIEKQWLQRLSQGPLSVYALLDSQDASLPEFFHLLQRWLQQGLVRLEHGRVALTEQGQALARQLGVFYEPVRCPHCQGTGYVLGPRLEQVYQRYLALTRERPRVKAEYDQGFIDPLGVMRRVAFMYERGDLTDTQIFIVGDDDLLSLAAALTGLPRRIMVMDIDQDLIAFIQRMAAAHQLPIEARVIDVQYALPEDLQGQFDVFVTDPVETLPGIELFLSRGASALRGVGSAGYFGLTTLEASRRKWYRIQSMLLQMGFVITDIRRQFNVYPDTEGNFFAFQDKLPIVQHLGVPTDHDWYRSAFYRIEAVEPPRPAVTGTRILDDAVYRDEESWATPHYGTSAE
ncbi:MAG: bis-aminopropyl spermidine synthase family protein [Chloroflexi bacterium]|nr:bis-aminopropyl spermidine synthase family protein [Chloroflexota bacterium]